MKTVVVCEAQVPFIRGGAEALSRELVREFRERGYDTELISIPFKWYPKEEILTHAAAWRLLDLSESNGRPIDLVICTKFPTYFVRHPRKVAWLIHQHRAAYELAGTPFSDFGHTDADGKDDANLDLSKRRAASVKAALAKEFGIDESRMETDGKGESEPIDKNDTPAGKANNRRVEFIKL